MAVVENRRPTREELRTLARRAEVNHRADPNVRELARGTTALLAELEAAESENNRLQAELEAVEANTDVLRDIARRRTPREVGS